MFLLLQLSRQQVFRLENDGSITTLSGKWFFMVEQSLYFQLIVAVPVS